MADTSVRIILGGSLGRAMGRSEWNLRLSKASPAEAIRAIDANTRGDLRRYLSGPGAKRHYKVALARKDNLLSKEELSQPTGSGTIYILPTVRGRESGAMKILAGVALVAFAILAGPAGWAIAGQGAGWLTAGVSLTVAAAGASLIIGGISQLLTPIPSFNQNNEAEGTTSHVFAGNAAAVSQGAALPLIYGRGLAPAVPISLSFTTFDKSISNSFPAQEYDIEYGEGGIVNYVPKALDPGVPN